MNPLVPIYALLGVGMFLFLRGLLMLRDDRRKRNG